MKTIRYIHWRDGRMWLGYLEDYPDYMTQGKSLRELQENLKDIYEELIGGHIPGVRKVAELRIASNGSTSSPRFSRRGAFSSGTAGGMTGIRIP